MSQFKMNKIFAISAIVAITSSGIAHAADKMYFRLRPSVSILNQDPFSVRIEGDREGVVGNRFAAKAEASSPRETLRFSISDGFLPAGVTLDPASGAIEGVPLARGRFAATVTAQDAFSAASSPLSVTVYDVLNIETVLDRYATVGKPYSATFTGRGGDLTYLWSFTGKAPDGLSFDGGRNPATLTGTPQTAGTFSGMNVSVSDKSGHAATSSEFSIAVAEPLVLTGTASAIATVGKNYSATFTSSGGHDPVSWALSGPSVPTWLSISNGALLGLPSEARNISGLRVEATDKAGNKASSNLFSIVVSDVLTISGSLPSVATVGTAIAETFKATGGNGSYRYEHISGSLPDGVTFNQGVIAGTPTKPGAFSNIVVRVTDGDRVAETVSFSITVHEQMTITTVAVSEGTVGVAYGSSAFAASGGDGNYTYSLAGSPLPNGMSLSGASIVGTPTAVGTWGGIIVRVTDGQGRVQNSNVVSITVRNPVSIATGATPDGTAGWGYGSGAFSASGGDGSYTYSLVSGTLPNGLYISGASIVGTPSFAGTWGSIVIRATDGKGRIANSNPVSIRVLNQVWMTGTASGSGKVGYWFDTWIYGNGGTGSYRWQVIGGSFPPGLNLDNGRVYGTPYQEGTFSFLVRVDDYAGRYQDQWFTISVAPQWTREPASGDYYDGGTYWVYWQSGGILRSTNIYWGGGNVANLFGEYGEHATGNVVYYRGAARSYGSYTYYGIYRIIY